MGPPINTIIDDSRTGIADHVITNTPLTGAITQPLWLRYRRQPGVRGPERVRRHPDLRPSPPITGNGRTHPQGRGRPPGRPSHGRSPGSGLHRYLAGQPAATGTGRGKLATAGPRSGTSPRRGRPTHCGQSDRRGVAYLFRGCLREQRSFRPGQGLSDGRHAGLPRVNRSGSTAQADQRFPQTMASRPTDGPPPKFAGTYHRDSTRRGGSASPRETGRLTTAARGRPALRFASGRGRLLPFDEQTILIVNESTPRFRVPVPRP